MHHLSITDLDCIEDIAASAAMAGAQAALDLADLGLSDTSRATHLAWIAKVLTSDALYDEASLVALAEFERELRGLVNREVYHTPLTATETEDELLVCELDLSELEAARFAMPWWRDRRPSLYHSLATSCPSDT